MKLTPQNTNVKRKCKHTNSKKSLTKMQHVWTWNIDTQTKSDGINPKPQWYLFKTIKAKEVLEGFLHKKKQVKCSMFYIGYTMIVHKKGLILSYWIKLLNPNPKSLVLTLGFRQPHNTNMYQCGLQDAKHAPPPKQVFSITFFGQ